MNAKLLRYPGSKWLKHIALWEEPALQQHLPNTARLTKESLKQFVLQYPVVFLKPIVGGGGKGVMKISRAGRHYLLQKRASARKFKTVAGLASALQTAIHSQKYLIQQGIALASIRNRPIDFRVLLIKEEQEWKAMGIMGKLAAKNNFVTNRCRGGRSITWKAAIRQSLRLSDQKLADIENKLMSVTMQISQKLNAEFPNITELGLDIAIDKNNHIWLLEANTRPQYQLFRDHDNRQLFKQIHQKLVRLRKQAL